MCNSGSSTTTTASLSVSDLLRSYRLSMQHEKDSAHIHRGGPIFEATDAEAPSAVLSAAGAAWAWLGTECTIRSTSSTDGIIGTVGLPDLWRLEVMVDDSRTESAWDALRAWKLDESWRLCAVVPLAAMGRAHDVLRDLRCDLQPWWVQDDGTVAFGSVELA